MQPTDKRIATVEQWQALKGVIDGNIGKARVLTAADYNWPTNNPTGVALWLLEPGIYEVGGDFRVQDTSTSTISNPGSSGRGAITIVGGARTDGGVNTKPIVSFAPNGANAYYAIVNKDTGVKSSRGRFLLSSDVKNILISTSATDPLSANQGRVLNEKIGDLTALDTTVQTDLVSAINEVAGSGGGIHTLTADDYNFPVASPSVIATWLLDPGIYYIEDNDNLHSKVYVTSSSSLSDDIDTIVVTKDSLGPNAGIYTFGVGAGLKRYVTVISTGIGTQTDFTPPNVVQTTGTSTTSVMSQDAATKLVYPSFGADASRIRIRGQALDTGAIAIGESSYADGNSGVAIGWAADARSIGSVGLGKNAKVPRNVPGAIALGSNSAPTQAGQIDVSSSASSEGYNSSNYRLLTGLYDPQSAHDAANKQYVDTAVAEAGAEEITNEDWSTLWQ